MIKLIKILVRSNGVNQVGIDQMGIEHLLLSATVMWIN